MAVETENWPLHSPECKTKCKQVYLNYLDCEMIAKHRGRPPRADARPELSLSADVCHSNAARGISDLTVI